MPRVTFVKKARKADKDYGIKKGDSYYWWKFRYGGKRVSKTYPRPSQLTQSEFYSCILSAKEDVQDALGNDEEAIDGDSLAVIDALNAARDTVEEQGSSCQDKLDNMPEGLQQGPTGELLQTRIDRCEELSGEIESAISDIENIEWPEKPKGKKGLDAYNEELETARNAVQESVDGISWEVD
jgi:hypothetical protein